jgi:hypothetical protein
MHHNPVENEFVMGFPLGWGGIYLARTSARSASTSLLFETRQGREGAPPSLPPTPSSILFVVPEFSGGYGILCRGRRFTLFGTSKASRFGPW